MPSYPAAQTPSSSTSSALSQTTTTSSSKLVLQTHAAVPTIKTFSLLDCAREMEREMLAARRNQELPPSSTTIPASTVSTQIPPSAAQTSSSSTSSALSQTTTTSSSKLVLQTHTAVPTIKTPSSLDLAREAARRDQVAKEFAKALFDLDILKVQELINKGIDLNTSLRKSDLPKVPSFSCESFSTLSLCCHLIQVNWSFENKNKAIEITKLVIRAGANVTDTDSIEQQPYVFRIASLLDYWDSNRREDLLKLIIDKGANINALHQGQTLLYQLCHQYFKRFQVFTKYQKNSLEVLLKHGADPKTILNQEQLPDHALEFLNRHSVTEFEIIKFAQEVVRKITRELNGKGWNCCFSLGKCDEITLFIETILVESKILFLFYRSQLNAFDNIKLKNFISILAQKISQALKTEFYFNSSLGMLNKKEFKIYLEDFILNWKKEHDTTLENDNQKKENDILNANKKMESSALQERIEQQARNQQQEQSAKAFAELKAQMENERRTHQEKVQQLERSIKEINNARAVDQRTTQEMLNKLSEQNNAAARNTQQRLRDIHNTIESNDCWDNTFGR
jgi:hypothetical protein